MKKWKCTVCGYVHEGPEPPETCPVCGAPASKFEEVVEKKPEPKPRDDGPIKEWRCTICGYVHEGPEPPGVCPVCGAPASKFEEVVDETTKEQAKPAPAEDPSPTSEPTPAPDDGMASMLYALVTDLMTKNQAHPIAVHIPNGLLPVVALFLFMSFVFGSMGFDTAAFYNLVVVALSMPMVIFSGYVDWQAKYQGAMTSVFKHKITMGAIVTALSWILVIWRLVDPQVSAAWDTSRYAFFGAHLAALGAAAYAGHLGGKLVFKD